MGIRIEKSSTDEEAIILEDACKKSLILRSNFPWIELWQYVSKKRRARVGYVNNSLHWHKNMLGHLSATLSVPRSKQFLESVI